MGNPGKFNSAGNVANWAEFLPPPPDHPPPHHRARSINQVSKLFYSKPIKLTVVCYRVILKLFGQF